MYTDSLDSSTLIMFYKAAPTTTLYTLPLHDALPISPDPRQHHRQRRAGTAVPVPTDLETGDLMRSEEHTSELQSPDHLVCRLLLEKKKKDVNRYYLF